ncbi:MAG TPA: DUF4382 domain-containing protein [Terriglobales bacterium]|nr:DUF4382 domain-containing protein [Terriglobales bacterium]
MRRVFSLAALAAILTFTFTACGGGAGSGSTNNTQGDTGATFVTAEDAPLPSVLAFNVTINSITLNNSSSSVNALSEATTVDFARLLGLRTLLAFNAVPAGTYTSATFSMSNPVVSYLDLSQNPPGVGTINGSFTAPNNTTSSTTTVTVSFSKPMVVTANGLSGLHVEFDLRQSLQVDGTGQVTGVVNPQIDLRPVAPKDDDAQITDLRGGLVSVNVAGNSFVIQRLHGHQITIDVNSSTTYSGTNNLSTLTTPAVIEVDGTVQNDGSVLASSVEVVTHHANFISGRIVAVNPTSGPAQTVTLLVGEEWPDIANIQVGFPVTLDVSQVQDYDICHVDNWFTNFLFNNSELVVGQRIAIGGTLDTTQNPAVLVPQRVVLRRQGVEGDLVAGSVNIVSGNQGSFQIQNSRLFGYILGAPLDVSTSNFTRFRNINGLSGLAAAGSAKVGTYGLVLKDNSTGNPRMYSHWVTVLP